MDNSNMLELLELYIDMVDKQDEIIRRLGKIISRQAATIELFKNDRLFSGTEVEYANKVMREYDSLREKIEP